jgi:hypothetical protein
MDKIINLWCHLMLQDDYWGNEYQIAPRPPTLAWPGLVTRRILNERIRPGQNFKTHPGQAAWPGRPPGACQAAGQAGSSDQNIFNIFAVM